jgi:hypothetical protein
MIGCQAKAAALAMVTDPGMGKPLSDPIAHLNELQARLLNAFTFG